MSQAKQAPKQTALKALQPGERRWFIIDADGKIVGRLASRVARVLMGKHRATWAPQVDNGDFVVITNAAKARMTGKKPQEKQYFRNTGYPSGLRIETYPEIMAKHPERIIEKAVRRMLPKTKLGDRMFGKLKVYAGSAHPHASQDPKALEVS